MQSKVADSLRVAVRALHEHDVRNIATVMYDSGTTSKCRCLFRAQNSARLQPDFYLLRA